MNDRFRFRIAAKFAAGWQRYEVSSIVFCTDGTIHAHGVKEECSATDFSIATAHFRVDGENAVLEQCIGLRDQDGKLVYEGDVLTPAHGMGPSFWVGWDGISWKFIRNGRPLVFASCDDAKNYILRSKIIGNIHDEEQSK